MNETIIASTSDNISGKANEPAGKARQGIADAMDHKEMRAKGLAQDSKGDAQTGKGAAKDG